MTFPKMAMANGLPNLIDRRRASGAAANEASAVVCRLTTGSLKTVEVVKSEDGRPSLPQGGTGNSGERGISIVELLIVVLMISIVSAFAFMQISAAQRSMRLTNSAREFLGWLEKARLDSLRRHPMSNGEMAYVTLTSNNSYTVVIDQNGDGSRDPARTITFPPTHGARFNGVTIPSTFYYDWRGRPVDSAGNSINLSFSLTDAVGNTNPVTISGGGDATLGSGANVSSVTVSSVNSSANIKAKTY